MSSQRIRRTVEESPPTYMDLLLMGKAFLDDIDDFVDEWHSAPEGSVAASRSLHEFLGMTWDEYRLWVEHPESLRFIVAAHRAGRPVDAVLEELDKTGVAARANGQSEARKLLQWLIDRGRVEQRPRH
jgi:hypothetical protein